MAQLRVSTIIPTFDRSRLLARALRSAVPQCSPGDEIIVVDDGSTDDTGLVTGSFGAPVRYVRSEHVGAGAARNLGVAAATGDIVAFLDSDDEWLPGKLARQKAAFQQNPDVLWLFSDFGSIGPSGSIGHHRVEGWKRADPRRWDQILGPSRRVAEDATAGPETESFPLNVGSLYETYIWSWCVFTSTVAVRRVEAGSALHFAEDVPTYEDFECYGRLAGRGPAGFMDCETALQGHQADWRLSDVDPVTHSDTAVRIIRRVWGEDDDYLREHRDEYEAAIDANLARKIHHLLGQGQRRDAQRVLALCHRAPRKYVASSYVPGPLMKALGDARRRSRRGAPT